MAVPISQELVDILVCPLCKMSVTATLDSAALRCLTCHRVYSIREGIPLMIPGAPNVAEPQEDSN